ncbi:MAG: hypothetical protein AAGB11_01395 [Pseudomonadota bacterium]
MIWNIIDKRKRKFRWREINAIIEDIEHDNITADSDFFDERNDAAPIYAAREGILLHDAILWAENQEGKVTLFIYDKGDGL